MKLINKETFVCLDCESTGLDAASDQIIELAAIKFTFEQTLDSYETLVDPCCPIPEASIVIHNITEQMVQGKPKIKEALPKFLNTIGNYPIVGHGVSFDIDLIHNAAKKFHVPCEIKASPMIDTLRLARLYGESPKNSLEKLRQHFNIQDEGAHRAMSDVIVNIEVFKRLSTKFKTLNALLERLKKPILLKSMPLGKHKLRPFNEIPIEYLYWAAKQNFDEDLLYSLRLEIKKRKKGNLYSQVTNPFSSL